MSKIDYGLQAKNDQLYNDSLTAYEQMRGRMSACISMDVWLKECGDDYNEFQTKVEEALKNSQEWQYDTKFGDQVDWYEGEIYAYRQMLKNIKQRKEK